MTKYQHFFICPVKHCECLKSFVDSDKLAKDATFETSCIYHGIMTHKYITSKVLTS